MASQQNKRAKGLLGAIGAVKLLAFDAIEKLSGTHFTVKGTFWPDTKGADKEKDFDMIVIGIVKDWRLHPGAPEKTGVKIGLCHDDDKDFTRDDKILGEHFWIVDQITFSKYFTAWKHEKEQLERAIVPEEWHYKWVLGHCRIKDNMSPSFHI